MCELDHEELRPLPLSNDEDDKGVHAGHRLRLRDRLRRDGIDTLEDYEVLELLLMYAIPQRNVNPIAHRLIEHFGTLAAVMDADESELCRVKGVGESTALLLTMLPALLGKYRRSKLGEKFVVTNFAQASEYCRTLFGEAHEECFYVICLDKGGHVLHPALMSRGTVDNVPVYPRKIVEIALRYHACNLLLAHNHPGGHCNASQADIDSTLRVAGALRLIDVGIVDHVVVCGDETYSMFSHEPFLSGGALGGGYVLCSPGPADRALCRGDDAAYDARRDVRNGRKERE